MSTSISSTVGPAVPADPPAAAVSWALAGLALSMLLSSLGTSIANVGLPTLAVAFAASFRQVQWVVLAYLLSITTLIVGVGRLGDMIGRRRVLLAGIAVFTVASVLCAIAPTLPLLLAARALQGFGAAAMMALTMAFVGATVPKERTGRAMGLLGTTSALGTALGPALGGLLIAALGWRALFAVNVPLGILAFVLAWRHLPADRAAPGAARAGFDIPGTLLLALTLGAYALALTTGRAGFGVAQIALLAGAAVGAGLFLLAETKAAAPLIRLELLRRPLLGTSLAVNVLVMTVMMATLVVGPFYLSRALGLDAAAVGLAVAVGPLVAALAGVPAGRLVDRFGASLATGVGLGAMATGTLLLAALPAACGVSGYVVPIAIVTAGFATFQAANNTAVMGDVSAEQRGLISGLLGLSRNLGLISGAAAMGALFSFAVGAADVATASPAAVGAGMRITFAAAALLVVAALVVAFGSRVRSAAAGLRRPGHSVRAARFKV